MELRCYVVVGVAPKSGAPPGLHLMRLGADLMSPDCTVPDRLIDFGFNREP